MILFAYVLVLVSVEKRLIEEVRKNDTLIIVGETGSGKTTRMCYHIIVYIKLYTCIQYLFIYIYIFVLLI